MRANFANADLQRRVAQDSTGGGGGNLLGGDAFEIRLRAAEAGIDVGRIEQMGHDVIEPAARQMAPRTDFSVSFGVVWSYRSGL